MATDRAPHLSRIGPLLRQGHRNASRAFAEALQPLGIEGRHYGVLLHIDLNGPLSQRRLMDLTGNDKSAMVRTVDDLERLGLAVRRPDARDRRAHAVELTEAGRRMRAEAGVIAEKVSAELLDGLSAAECETLIGLLERFVAQGTGRPVQ